MKRISEHIRIEHERQPTAEDGVDGMIKNFGNREAQWMSYPKQQHGTVVMSRTIVCKPCGNTSASGTIMRSRECSRISEGRLAKKRDDPEKLRTRKATIQKAVDAVLRQLPASDDVCKPC